MERYFALAIALLRAREAGDNVTDEMVLLECQDWDVDAGPVMILVQGKAPERLIATYPLPDGTVMRTPVRGDRYIPINWDHNYTNTPAMNGAMGLRIASRR